MRDVRMRGFAERADVEEVERFLAERTRRLPGEPVPLLDCAGRVLAEDVKAAVDVPGFARSAMDGYARARRGHLRRVELRPLRAPPAAGEALPGPPFAGRVGPGEAVRIMTGAPLPEGADAVVMAEVCEERGGSVLVGDAVPPRKNVGEVGRGRPRRRRACCAPAGGCVPRTRACWRRSASRRSAASAGRACAS